ncbi:MAG: hypothetical protein IH620_01770 [Ignavibacterium sp.]|nr:hypothetical protein [Ignavibacterium sp.]
MNLEKIYTAVESDEMNSPLITICDELVRQGYKVFVEGFEICNDEMSNNLLNDLEQTTNEFNVEIKKNGLVENFKLVFTEYHGFKIMNWCEGL